MGTSMSGTIIAFSTLFTLVITQRLIELGIAKRNTQLLLQQGAVEFGKNHYWAMVTLHVSFFLSLLVEGGISGIHLHPYWPYLLALFFLAQICRIWIIKTMQGRWTTRIIVLPGKPRVQKGPFRWIPHPNYLVVAIELITLPFIFELYWTAGLFTLLNAFVLLCIRIPEENRALNFKQN